MPETGIEIQPALTAEADGIYDFLQPFVDDGHLLQRSIDEIIHLTRHAFVARDGDRIVGFAAVEVYSRKLAEIQCLSVSPDHQRMGIGRRLVERCIERAAEQNVLELMAITASDDFLRSCGFDYSLPSQKRALFVQPRDFVKENDGDETQVRCSSSSRP
jgi:amino-acid N-acetyltransferase